jgi:hypothetical protein
MSYHSRFDDNNLTVNNKSYNDGSPKRKYSPNKRSMISNSPSKKD